MALSKSALSELLMHYALAATSTLSVRHWH